jgi:anti-sigma regulatory factor (Ser/Thr protein kinase)
MDMNALRINDRSNVAELRRAVGACARAMDWDDTACGESEIVATELATNLMKHARDGIVALASTPGVPPGDLLLVAVDRGPGIADLARSFADGFSTAGSPGTGLGAIRRLAYETDILSDPTGTVLVAELRARTRGSHAPERARVRVAAFGAPKEGQIVSGDAWAHRWLNGALAIMVCDGLGHGDQANKAAVRAIECFNDSPWDTPTQAVANMNDALRSTRGAAAAVAIIDLAARRVHFCGVGNIVAGIVSDERAHHMVSHNGIVGAAKRFVGFDYEWPPGATLMMHSDGLSSRWPLPRWSGLWSRHPGLIAGIAYRDLARGTDDAVVVVARDHGTAA